MPKNKREAYQLLFDYILDLSEKKDLDYSPQNIGLYGELGVAVRVGDKAMRLKSLLVDKRVQRVNDESVEDTWFDLTNYGLIAVMLRHNWWLELDWGNNQEKTQPEKPEVDREAPVE
ncbi:MAG: hypothetical protein WC805_03550 [Patescibacteria group bacterium]